MFRVFGISLERWDHPMGNGGKWYHGTLPLFSLTSALTLADNQGLPQLRCDFDLGWENHEKPKSPLCLLPFSETGTFYAMCWWPTLNKNLPVSSLDHCSLPVILVLPGPCPDILLWSWIPPSNWFLERSAVFLVKLHCWGSYCHLPCRVHGGGHESLEALLSGMGLVM